MYSLSFAGISIGCVVGGFSLYIAKETVQFKGEKAKKNLPKYIIGIFSYYDSYKRMAGYKNGRLYPGRRLL